MSNIPDIDTIVAEAIGQQIWPGAVVMASHNGSISHASAIGTTMYADSGSLPVQLATRYDIASLTKVFTATAALQLVDAGAIDLDRPVASYLDRMQAREVTVRHLLTHTSGLHVRLSVLRTGGRAGIFDAVYATLPTTPPGAAVAYTNVNSLLLGEIVALVRGMPLDQAIERFVLDPLGLDQTGFVPAAALHPIIAPTEWDHEWRRKLVHGSVHDESAHALGGVAGHAGLFSSARDILRFCEAWRTHNVPFVSPEVAALAVENHTPEQPLACGLGWMRDRRNFMGNAPTGSYGHTGFTGPAMVVIPAYDLSIVVLCNRTYPQRRSPAHHAIIGQIVTTMIDSIAIPSKEV